MNRLATLPLLALTAASSPMPAVPDMVATGRVMAELQGFQLILYVLILLLFLQFIERVWAAHTLRQERKAIDELVKAMGPANERLADALGALKTEIAVFRMAVARIESGSG